jgi:hypothetical protein
MRSKPRRTELWASYPGLNLYVPDPEYIFAMKAEAARVGTSDIDDLKALIKAAYRLHEPWFLVPGVALRAWLLVPGVGIDDYVPEDP